MSDLSHEDIVAECSAAWDNTRVPGDRFWSELPTDMQVLAMQCFKRGAAAIPPLPPTDDAGLIERLAAHLCDQYDADFYPARDHQWPEDANDDGKREGGYVPIQPKHVQARARESAKRILALICASTRPELNFMDAKDDAALAWIAKNIMALRKDDGSMWYRLPQVVRAYQAGVDFNAPASGDTQPGLVVTDDLAKLRDAGWMVAVHNDYRQDGVPMTFWLFAHVNGRWVKGEGRTDVEALSIALTAALQGAP